MSHSHHHHGPATASRHGAFAIGIVLNLVFVVVEAFYGLVSGSMALLADAGHNLSDVLGLVLAWGALWLAGRGRSKYRTYGMRKTTILAALINALVLLVAIGGIAWESIRRFVSPAEVASETVIVVALIGTVINAATMMLFMKGNREDLNIRGAFLHMAADAGVSLGVVLGGLLIYWTGYQWIDPTISLVIVAVIFWGTWGLLRESVNLSLDGVPSGIDPDEVLSDLESIPGVTGAHHLHIWAMSTTETALTAHLVKPDSSDDDACARRVSQRMHERFGIGHVTIQWERHPENCADA